MFCASGVVRKSYRNEAATLCMVRQPRYMGRNFQVQPENYARSMKKLKIRSTLLYKKSKSVTYCTIIFLPVMVYYDTNNKFAVL